MMGYLKGFLCGVLFCFLGTLVWAGGLDDPGPPTSPDSGMYTLKNIYDRLNENKQASKRAGAFTEPSAGPGSTGPTLNDVYEKAIPTQVPKTGQTTSYGTRDDGALRQGVAWPNPRFTDNNNGTVTDNLTGLIWLKNANCAGGLRTWDTALSDVVSLNTNGTMNGNNCGDTSNSGSHQTDWSLPNVLQLLSLIAWGYFNPALSNTAGTAQWTEGNPFTAVQSGYYWSSTTNADLTSYAWSVFLGYGYVYYDARTFMFYVWPVRAGQ